MPLEFPPFNPHPLCRGGHLQTIAGCYLPWQRVPYQAVQHQVPLADGDHILLHDDCPAGWSPADPTVLLIHGLGGSYLSGYMQRCMVKLTAQGMRVFRMDLRGCGAGFALAKHPIHAGRSDDVAAALSYLMEKCPGSPLHAAGFSMGANMILKMAGEWGAAAPRELVSLAAISPPIDLIECCRRIQIGAGRFYDRSFVTGLMRHIRRRQQLIPGALSRPVLPTTRRLVEFDNQFTAPLAGFVDAYEYYTHASSGPLLARITVPTLIVAAATDPIVPIDPFEKASYSPTTQLLVTPCGGHLGFIGRQGDDSDRRWIDWRVGEWITAHQPQRSLAMPRPPAETRHRRPLVRAASA
jgi:predicted alpha/beta-fold hydrolase